MSEIEFAGKSTVIFWAHNSLEIIGYWMDNRKMDKAIKQRLGESYCRDEEMVMCICLTEGWCKTVLQFYTTYIQNLE